MNSIHDNHSTSNRPNNKKVTRAPNNLFAVKGPTSPGKQELPESQNIVHMERAQNWELQQSGTVETQRSTTCGWDKEPHGSDYLGFLIAVMLRWGLWLEEEWAGVGDGMDSLPQWLEDLSAAKSRLTRNLPQRQNSTWQKCRPVIGTLYANSPSTC